MILLEFIDMARNGNIQECNDKCIWEYHVVIIFPFPENGSSDRLIIARSHS